VLKKKKKTYHKCLPGVELSIVADWNWGRKITLGLAWTWGTWYGNIPAFPAIYFLLPSVNAFRHLLWVQNWWRCFERLKKTKQNNSYFLVLASPLLVLCISDHLGLHPLPHLLLVYTHCPVSPTVINTINKYPD
jgi:hypothetical protein